MSPKKRGAGRDDKATANEREQRVAAAQARRNAGFLKAKVGDDLPVQLEEHEEDQKQPTMFDLLVRHKYVGIPLRVVQARMEAKRRRKEAAEAREAKRVWDMMMLLEPGMRVKLVHVGRIGGVKYDGKLATVIADVGNRYAVRLDLVDPDGTVHEGQGAEIKISAHNMEIYDEEVERALEEADVLANIKRKEERAELLRDVWQGRWKKILNKEGEADEADEDPNGETAAAAELDPFEGVVIEFEDLSIDSTMEELRHFHTSKKMKVKLMKHDTQDEVLEKIKEEWTSRLEAIKKFDRSLLDAEAAINVGIKIPSVRDDFRRFMLNPAFAIGRLGLKDARSQLVQLFSCELTKGTLQSGGLEKVQLDKHPAEKGGPSMEENAYVGKQLLFTGGMAAGQYGIISHYHPVDPMTGEEKICEILHWYTANAEKSTKYQVMNADYGDLHVRGQARSGDKATITLAEDADSMKNSYKGMLIKITKGPGKSQRAKILAYDGETKQCLVDKWIWDKSLFEKAFDQDDDNIPTVPPTDQSHYHLKMEDHKERTVPLHLAGRSAKDGYDGVIFLSKDAPAFDMYSGRTIVVIGGIGRGQQTRIVSYDTGRKLCKIEPWQASVPDKTSKYRVVEYEHEEERLFTVENQLVKMEARSRIAAMKDEKERRNKIRRRMWAAVRIHMMGVREGAKIEETRMKQAAEAWAAVNDDNEAEDDGNIHMVNGKPVMCTWKSIVLDSEPAFEEVEVIPSDEECDAVLHIKVKQARDLLAADSGGTSDPYVRIHIGDDVKGGVKTKHISKTLNPVWNERFELLVRGSQRPENVTVEVFDKDMIGRDDSLGKFCLELPLLTLHEKASGPQAAKLLSTSWQTFDPVPKEHPSDPDNNGELEIEYELVRRERDDDDGAAPVTRRQLREGVLAWKGYPFKIPLYSAVDRNKDGSIVQPLLILNEDNGQQLYKGNTSHWKVWQSLIEEGDQLDDRDDVFRWHDRLVLQPLTTISEEGVDIYTVVDNDTGQILYSGPDEEPKPGEAEELENQLRAIVPHHDGAEDHGMNFKKFDDERAVLASAHDSERAAAAKSLSSQANSSAQLKLTVVRAKDLIASDRGGTSDPYVVVKVGPGGDAAPYFETKTRVVYKTVTPEYGETFDFNLEPKQRRGVLSLQVFDKDKYDKDDALGTFEVPLHTLEPSTQYDKWHPLGMENEDGHVQIQGEVHLLYKLTPKLPPALLQIEILQAKDLIAADSGGTSDPYVRVHIGDEVNQGQKTTVKKKSLSPEWGEKFEMHIRSEQRRDTVSIECFDYDAISADDSLGKFSIALDDLVPATEYCEWRPFDRDVSDVNDINQGQLEIRYSVLPILGPAVLDIQVLRARNLLAADRGGTSDPYLRIHVGNEISAAVKTTVKKKTLEPVWEENFSIQLESAQRRQRLSIECFDKDMVGADDSLGLSTLELGELVNKQTYKEWRKLDNVAENGPENQGEVEMKYKLQEVNDDDEAGGLHLEDSAALPTHTTGGQEWDNVQDPELWKSLMDESVQIPGEEDKFSWRGIVCHQPERDGPNQVVESVGGDIVFLGPNPNEASDFPSLMEQEETMRQRKLEAKGKITKMAIETEDGKYEGGMRQGQFQGDGLFMWNDGVVYSGQYVDDLREGTGTEIFPPYDNEQIDEATGEKTFPYYEGQFLDGQRHGKGIYHYANGDFYKGMFAYNVFHGLGVFSWEDGDYLECKWKDGLPLEKNIKYMEKRGSTRGSAAGSTAGSEKTEKKKKKKRKKDQKGKKKGSSPGGEYGFDGHKV